jgi:hypothetical protein
MRYGARAASTAGFVLVLCGLAVPAAASPSIPSPPVPATNLALLPGPGLDVPPEGTRALSAAPVFAVTGAPLELRVTRAGGQLTVRQDGMPSAVRPHSMLQGLPGFFQWKLLRPDGSVAAAARVDVCPMPGTGFTFGAWGLNLATNLDPANPAVTDTFPYPPECGDPLTTSALWGFPAGWGARLHVHVPDSTRPGSYVLDASINADGAVRETSGADDQVRMPVEVLDLTVGPAARQAAARRHIFDTAPGVPAGEAAGTEPPPPLAQPTGRRLPEYSGGPADLPDLVPLPSENIAVQPDGGKDLLRFNSTLANLGPGRLQVEGFRAGAPADQMLAYQTLFHQGVEVGRRSAGTLVFEPDESEWHLDYLARYRLLDRRGTVVATSDKVGFCMADMHQLDATNPGFVATPALGFTACIGATAQSVREAIDPGWGDEYDQAIPEQELDITGAPNGTYQLQILADPEHKLLESNRDNDASVRAIVLGGRPGARTVSVAPVDGVDTEAAWAATPLAILDQDPAAVPSRGLVAEIRHAFLIAGTTGWRILWALVLGFVFVAVRRAAAAGPRVFSGAGYTSTAQLFVGQWIEAWPTVVGGLLAAGAAATWVVQAGIGWNLTTWLNLGALALAAVLAIRYLLARSRVGDG